MLENGAPTAGSCPPASSNLLPEVQSRGQKDGVIATSTSGVESIPIWITWKTRSAECAATPSPVFYNVPDATERRPLS